MAKAPKPLSKPPRTSTDQPNAQTTDQREGHMDEGTLKAAIKNQIFTATGYLGGQITEDRRTAMRDYLGEPMGNEIEGRSQVISTDVQDVVEALMPDLVQIFTSSDRSVEFLPTGSEDEEAADQATDYVNHIWNVDNDGFGIIYDWFKDALLQINGIIKIWWDESEVITQQKLTGITDDSLALLLMDDEVEILEHTESIEAEDAAMLEEAGIEEGMDEYEAADRVHDVTIKRTRPGGRVRVMNVPPEEFLISRRARSLDDAPFLAHWVHRTVSDLLDEGYNRAQIENIPSDGEQEFNEERVTRFNRDDEWPFQEKEIDKSTREIRVYECYVKADWDQDGIAELLKVTVAGPGYDILTFENGDMDVEQVADHPFATITPIRMPHKFFGRSIAELVQDIQQVKTAIWRQTLDNMYQINNGRAAISNKVSLEDYLDNKVAAPIRVDSDQADIGGHIVPVQTASIGATAYPLLEYVDTVRETRTGVTRLGQGLDPDALNSTARGINQLLGRTQQRTLLIAQSFANGVRDAFKKILKLTIDHQERTRVLRLRNKWTEIDPRSWNAQMDVSVNVGLGRGTQDQRIATMNLVMQQMQGIIGMQGGTDGPLVYLHHYRNAVEQFYEAAGIKSPDPYMDQITAEEAHKLSEQKAQQPPPPDPKVVEAEKKHERELMAMQLQHMREMQKNGVQVDLEQAKLELAAAQDAAKIAMEQEKLYEQEHTKRLQIASRGNGQG
jgi:hypothetical protein